MSKPKPQPKPTQQKINGADVIQVSVAKISGKCFEYHPGVGVRFSLPIKNLTDAGYKAEEGTLFWVKRSDLACIIPKSETEDLEKSD